MPLQMPGMEQSSCPSIFRATSAGKRLSTSLHSRTGEGEAWFGFGVGCGYGDAMSCILCTKRRLEFLHCFPNRLLMYRGAHSAIIDANSRAL